MTGLGDFAGAQVKGDDPERGFEPPIKGPYRALTKSGGIFTP